MPKFIKMGLGGTGYMSKKESYLRSAKRRKSRRVIIDGFPILEPFKSIEDVRHYLSGDMVVCLLCGKSYKKLGNHLRIIHQIKVDEYRERYNIPWTYGVLGKESSNAYSLAIKKRMAEGWLPPMKTGADQARMLANLPRRKEVFKTEIAKQNFIMWKPRHPLMINPDGELETFTDRRERLKSKKGTPEFHEKMKNRPQCDPKVNGDYFVYYWRGKKQSEEHKRKRIYRDLPKA